MEEKISRREAVKRVAWIMGGVVSAPTVAGVLNGCAAEEGWTPQTLSADQDEMVTMVSDMIIPETDTPGARAANVNHFIDKMLTEWYDADVRDQFTSQLDQTAGRAEQELGQPFVEASAEERTQFLRTLEKEAVQARTEGKEGPVPFFDRIKELTLLGYYTSQVGMEEELHWMPVPGYYDGCVPFEEVGRVWSQ